MNFKKTALASAVAVVAGLPAGQAAADTLAMSWSGAFTMIEPSGTSTLFNTAPGAAVAPYWGYRTAVSGTMSFDLTNGSGTGVVDPFSFFAGGLAAATTITFQAIGNGFGDPNGSLVLGNMGFNWSGNNGIPVSIVMDAAGLFGYLGGFDPNANPSDGFTSDTLSGFGATSASDGQTWNSGTATFSLPMGPSPMVTTTWNTTAIGGSTALGDNPSGTLPLVANTVPGNPMATAPFPNHYANFDVTVVHIDSFTPTPTGAVPIPAAVWLFGSGLLGLVGVARRRKSS